MNNVIISFDDVSIFFTVELTVLKLLTWFNLSLYFMQVQTSPPQSNLGRARGRPNWLQWDAPNSPLKLPLLFDDRHLI